MIQKTKTELDRVATDYLMVGYHLEAIESFLNPKFTKYYELGRNTVYNPVHCPTCDKAFSDYQSIRFIEELGECLGCNQIRMDFGHSEDIDGEDY